MIKILFSVLVLSLISACSMNTVQYQPDFNLVNDMKDSNLQKISVGDISSKNPKVNKVSIRGSSMVSTLNNSYAEYLEAALREQLQQSNLYDSSSTISIAGELLTNQVNAAGFSAGTADIAARFEVLNSDKVVFDKVVTITHEWDSSFFGAIAIPNAQNNYPIAIQKLISKLMTDQDFISSIQRE